MAWKSRTDFSTLGSRMNHSPVVDRIILHYRRLGLDKGWTVDQFDQLCLEIGCTRDELGVLCGMNHHYTKRLAELGRFPPYVAIQLAMIKSAIREAKTGEITAPIMPIGFLAKESPATQPPHHD